MKINGISISGAPGPTGPAGAPAGLRYNTKNDQSGSLDGTADALFMWEIEEGNPVTVNGIIISHTDLTATSVASQIAIAGQSSSAVKGYIIIKSDDGTIFRVFTVTNYAYVYSPGYTFMAGTLDDSSTFFSTPCTLQFIRNGDSGVRG